MQAIALSKSLIRNVSIWPVFHTLVSPIPLLSQRFGVFHGWDTSSSYQVMDDGIEILRVVSGYRDLNPVFKKS